jgi:hypothetical protein
MRDLGINPDVAESQFIDLLNEVFGDPKAAARFMAKMRAAGEELRRTGLSALEGEPPRRRTRKAQPD